MNWADRISKGIRLVSTILFIVMTCITFIQAVSRYLFGYSFFWGEELARFSMIWICFLGAALAVSNDSHTRITFFINFLPQRLRKIIYVFDDIVCLVFMCVITYYSINVMKLTMPNRSAGMNLPLGFVYGSLTVAGFMMIVYYLIRIYDAVKIDRFTEVK